MNQSLREMKRQKRLKVYIHHVHNNYLIHLHVIFINIDEDEDDALLIP